MMTKSLTLDSFAGVLNTTFRLHADADHIVEVVLAEATDELATGNRKPVPNQEVFSLVFVGPPNHPLVQGTFRLEHDALGAMDLFLVPIAENEAGLHYQAVFNRMKTAE